MASTRTEIEAYAFRQLVAHLQARTDSQNIDMMNLAGFCRNCLSKWYLKGARVQGDAHMTYDEALEIVYGEPYGDWKKKHQSKATDEQMAAFEGNKHLHAKHDEDLLDPPAPRPEGAAPPPKPNPTVLSDVCCTPADECAPPGAAASARPGSFRAVTSGHRIDNHVHKRLLAQQCLPDLRLFIWALQSTVAVPTPPPKRVGGVCS